MPENAYSRAHGHHESVLRSHSWRTAQNSAAYLIKYLQPTMHILDVGCGPATITVSLARLVPEGHVTGIEHAPEDSDVFQSARKHAAEQGVTNVSFARGDVLNLEGIPDDTYDVVHCHQVLQHVADPVQALREMKRVAKPGGLVAAREWDSKSAAWYPETDGFGDLFVLYQAMSRASGCESVAGRRLVSWALAAGFRREEVDASAGGWCYSTPEERAWIAGVQAERILKSTFATRAVEVGLADQEKLESIANQWRVWATREDGWLALFHGEIICRV